MPQIANQDYNVVAPQYAEVIMNDAAALGMLAGHIERGTIWDVIVKTVITSPQENCSVRILSIYSRPSDSRIINTIALYNGYDDEINTIDIKCSPTQYEGLAAVQVACEDSSGLPELTIDADAYLKDSTSDYYLCVDGKLVSVATDDDDNISSLTVSTESPAEGADWVNVPYEDLQKLIGLPAA